MQINKIPHCKIVLCFETSYGSPLLKARYFSLYLSCCCLLTDILYVERMWYKNWESMNLKEEGSIF